MSHVKMDCPSLAIAHKRERAARAVVLPEAASSADIFPPSAYFHALSLKEIPDCLHRPPLAIETVFSFLFHLDEGYLAGFVAGPCVWSCERHEIFSTVS